MAYKILVSVEAQNDIENSFLYYRDHAGKRVADNFLKDVRNSLRVISQNPFFKIRYDSFRAKPLKKYPFLIFFTIDTVDENILVARVFHTAQNPRKYPE